MGRAPMSDMHDILEAYHGLKVFYRTVPTEQLILYRATFTEQRDAAQRRKLGSVTFFETRRRLIAEVLKERGVEALT